MDDAKCLIAELLAFGLTQMEMERRTGIDQSTISAIHTGRRGKRVSYEVMSKLKALRDEMKSQRGVEARAAGAGESEVVA